MEKTFHLSDISGEIIQNVDVQLVTMNVLEHPDTDEPVRIEMLTAEAEPIGKLAVAKYVLADVWMPGEDEPQRHVFTPANFAKLSPSRPIAEVLAEAKTIAPEKPAPDMKVGNGNGDPQDKWGMPKKGRTSPAEAQWVRENLGLINQRRQEKGIPPIDPAHPDHIRRYGFTMASGDTPQLPVDVQPAIQETPPQPA